MLDGSMAARTRERQLSERFGVPVEEVREWVRRGLVDLAEPEHLLRERARLIRMFERRGIALDVIERSLRGGYLAERLEPYLAALFPGADRAAVPFVEAARRIGFTPEELRRMVDCVTPGNPREELNSEDIESLRMCKRVIDAGLPEEAMLQLVRTWADSLRRAAEATQRLFHFYIHDSGAKEAGVRNLAQGGYELRPLLDAAILYFLRKGMVQAEPEDFVMHLTEEAGLSNPPETPGQITATIAFIDLARFSSLADSMGDLRAAEVLERFALMVRTAAGARDGRVVKQIGDAFLLAFSDARDAIECCLEIEERACTEPQFPALRCGIHHGRVLYREADYVGSNVNQAARVADEARPHQILVTAAVRDAAGTLEGVELMHQGPRELRGIADPVELFAAYRDSGHESNRKTDPVCGMELGPGQIAARLDLGGTESFFCSQECLRLFVTRRFPQPRKHEGAKARRDEERRSR